VIHVYDDAGNVIETHEHNGEFENSGDALCRRSPLHPANYGVQPDVSKPLL
jgi:hypothetical protein